jgi:hypothetical protein
MRVSEKSDEHGQEKHCVDHENAYRIGEGLVRA